MCPSQSAKWWVTHAEISVPTKNAQPFTYSSPPRTHTHTRVVRRLCFQPSATYVQPVAQQKPNFPPPLAIRFIYQPSATHHSSSRRPCFSEAPPPPLFLRTLAPMTLAAEHCIVPACLASCIHVNGRGGCSRMVGKGVIAVDGGDGGVSKFVAVGG